MKAIHNNIKTLRESHGLKLREFAAIAGISVSHLSLIERGERTPSFELFRKICRAFHITPNKLAGDNAD